MKLLLTNDDGLQAPGLEALRQATASLGEPIVVAPANPISGCSHSATTDRPFRVVRLKPDLYAVDGTPADCVRVAIHRFESEIRCVFAGINNGGNLGVDVYHSGTVAAVREAVLRGLPGIAVSQYRSRPMIESDWKRALEWTKPLLAELIGRPWTPGTFWNINLPSLNPGPGRPDVIFCPLDPSPLPLSFSEEREMLHYDGKYAKRQRQKGSDVEVCLSGKIAVTQVWVMEPSR